MTTRRIHPLPTLVILLALLIAPSGAAQSETGSGPTPPVLTANTGLSTHRGESEIVTTRQLHAENGAVPPQRLYYTLQSVPQHGALTRNGATLAVGEAFTQADIDAGLIGYTQNGDSSGQDNWQFILSHGPLIERVSVQGDGTPVIDHTDDLNFRLSGDGEHVVFFSAQAVVPMAYNGKNNVFMRDLETGGILLVSHGAAGTLSNGDSILPCVSYDGRYVAFASNASNLIADSTANPSDYHIYRFDTLLQKMEKVDLFPVGQSSLLLQTVGISADGQVILYTVDRPDQDRAIYVYDFNTQTQTQITTFPQPNAGWGALSANGQYVATSNGLLFDRQTNSSQPIPNLSDYFTLSDDGRYLAFIGDDGLAPGDNNGAEDTLVYDRVTNTYELISPPDLLPGLLANHVVAPSISADSRFAAYSAYPTTSPQNLQVIVHDRVLHTDRVVSTSITGQPGNGDSLFGNLSQYGDRIVFSSTATDLDGRSEPGWYVRQLLTSDVQTFTISIDPHWYHYLPVIRASD